MTKHRKLFLLYILAFILYLYYFLNLKLGMNISNVYFWIAIVCMIISLFVQIVYFNFTKLQLFEIIIFRFAVQLMYVVPHYGLFGWDPEINLYISNFISSQGWSTSLSECKYIGIHWPILSIFSLISSFLLNMQLLDVAKWLPSVYSSLGIIFIYLISKNIFYNEKSALLTCFLMSTVSWYAEFHSWYVQESIGFVFMLSLLFLYFKQRSIISSSNNTLRYRLISIVLLFTLIMSHHFSSFLFVVVMITFYITQKVYSQINYKSTSLSLLFPVLSFLALLSYWIFIAPYPFQKIVSIYVNVFINDAGSLSLSGYVPLVDLTLRQLVVRYGNYLFVVVFGIISLYSVYIQRGSQKFGVILSILVFNFLLVGLYFSSVIFPKAISLATTRIFMYGWLFSLLLSMSIFLGIKDKYSKIFVVFCFIFVIFNFYSISPYIYSTSYEPQYNIHEFSFSHPLHEYKAVEWYDKHNTGNSVIVSGQNAKELFVGSDVTKICKDVNLFKGNLSKINSYDWVYIYDEMFDIIYDYENSYLTKMSKRTLHIYNSESSINLVYNNDLTRFYVKRDSIWGH